MFIRRRRSISIENELIPSSIVRRTFTVYVLTDKIGCLESYSIDMQALTGYRLSRTQVIMESLIAPFDAYKGDKPYIFVRYAHYEPKAVFHHFHLIA